MDNFYSFVLPAYKIEYFKEAIESILVQTYSNFELIIVNDASPYDLDSIVNKYDDARIRYYKNEVNIGGNDLVAQWNHCLEYANGEFIILASDDDIYSPQYLEQMNELIKKYPNVNVFRPRVQKINTNGDIIGVEGYLDEQISQLEFIYQLYKNYIYSGIPYYIFKKSALIDNGRFKNFPLAWFSDDATVMILAKNCIATSSKVLFSFRISGQSISSAPNTMNTLTKKITATKEYYKWFELFLNNLSEEDTTHIFYKKHLLSNIEVKKTEHIWQIIGNINKYILIQNFFYIKVLCGFNFIKLLKYIIRRFF